MKFSCPLRILERTRKRDGKEFWSSLNLNEYTRIATAPGRRSVFKRSFFEVIIESLKDLPAISDGVRVKIRYTLWVQTRRRCDLMNYVSVVDKMVSDALVEAGVLADDSTKEISQIEAVFGGVDKLNPRCDVEIVEVGKGD